MIAMTGARATAMTETRARDTETTTRVIKGAIGAASIATTTMTTKEGKTKGKEKGKGSIATTTTITARIEGTTATAATTAAATMKNTPSGSDCSGSERNGYAKPSPDAAAPRSASSVLPPPVPPNYHS